MAKTVGIDVGGTNLRLGIFSELTLVEEFRHQADFSKICHAQPAEIAWAAILEIVAEGIQKALAMHPDIQSIGIGFPGFIDPSSQCIASSPNLPGLQNVNLAADLSQILSKKIIVENDALAAAYGEYCIVGMPETGLIYVGLGTGVGGGLIYGNKPFPGVHGVAMEVGHLIIEPNGRTCGCGNQGCLEQYASASGIVISYGDASKTAFDIAQLARAGDAQAINAYAKAGTAIAIALAHVLKVVDVPNVVIGGGPSQAWDLMQDSFYARLEADLIPVLRGKIKVQISTAGDQAGMLGAALLSRMN